MTSTAVPTPGVSPENVIVHKQRQIRDDVNPLIKSSAQSINNLYDNFMVVKLKDGQVMLASDVSKNGFFKNMFNGVVKFYEVDKRRYPFALEISSPTHQASFKYTVTMEFEINVIDPCTIVSQSITSLLESVTTDLKRMASEVTMQYSIEETKRAAELLRDRLDAFRAPPYVFFWPGVVDVAPDSAALKMLRQIEEERLRLRGEQVRANVGVAESVATSITQKAGELIEDHQVARVVNRLGEIGMNPLVDSDASPK
jgi:hypothetical protein